MLALACRVIEAVPGPGEVYFAVGSTLFAWLLLSGRMVPVAIAGLGVLASGLLGVTRAGLFGGPVNWSSFVTWLIWLPLLVFEVALALWLLIKGVAPLERHAGGGPKPTGEDIRRLERRIAGLARRG